MCNRMLYIDLYSTWFVSDLPTFSRADLGQRLLQVIAAEVSFK